nr:hypothetical protein GCM10017745_41480 [Saccharothrix mutabilis subsp. capreolus]
MAAMTPEQGERFGASGRRVTRRQVDAAEALRLGLVNAVFEDRAAVPAAARAVPRRTARDSTDAVPLTKAVLNGVR